MTPGTHWSRREFMRHGLLVAATVIVPTGVACSRGTTETLGQARDRGFIRIGFADERPYGHTSDLGVPTGQGPELARMVFRELGVPDIDGVLSPFGRLIDGLLEERFDVIAAGMFITPERCERVIFSDPHFCIEQAFLVTGGNPHGIVRYEDFVGDSTLDLGVVIGTVEAEQAADSGIPPVQVIGVDNPTDLVAALRAGRIDAAALSTVSLASLADQASLNGFEVTPSFAYRGQLGCGAFGFRPDDTELRDEFNRVLHSLVETPDVRGMMGSFGFEEAANAAEGKTASHLCQR